MKGEGSIVVIDDSQDDLNRFEQATPGVISLYCVHHRPAGGVDAQITDLLADLRTIIAKGFVVDLRWSDSDRHLDGLRFVRRGIESQLFTTSPVVLWSAYLDQAHVQIKRLMELARANKIAVFLYQKPHVPTLDFFTGVNYASRKGNRRIR